MKTAAIPSVRVDPELRDQLEQVLREGETLSTFVEASVRDAVRRRVERSAFMARGLASIEHARTSGHLIEPVDVIATLEKRLAAARKRISRKHSASR